MRHVRTDNEADGTLEPASRRRAALAAGLAGLAVGAVIVGGGIAPTGHASEFLSTAPFVAGGGPPPPPAPPPPDQNEPGPPPAGAPGDPGAPPPSPGVAPPAP